MSVKPKTLVEYQSQALKAIAALNATPGAHRAIVYVTDAKGLPYAQLKATRMRYRYTRTVRTKAGRKRIQRTHINPNHIHLTFNRLTPGSYLFREQRRKQRLGSFTEIVVR